MSYCSAPVLPFLHYLDENKFLTILTSFTFLVIGVFIYILRCYSYLEKQHIPRAARPTVPFGNIQDVVVRNTTLCEYFLKYYNKFKRKNCKFGGIYILNKPAVLIVDNKLLNDVIENTNKSDPDKIENFKEIQEYILNNSKNINDNFVKKPDNIKSLLINLSCLTFGLENTDLVLQDVKDFNESTFWYYLTLTYPILKRFKQRGYFLENKILYRKKNDIKKSDILQNYQGNFNELYLCFINNVNHLFSIIDMCLYELCSNKNIQDDLIGEIRRFHKEFNVLTVNNINLLNCLDAIIQETLRKYPPVPVYFRRCNSEYKSPFGFKLPSDGFVVVSTYGIHHDPKNYVNPEEFDVDRFMDNPEFDVFYPYGFGLQNVIGMNFTTFLAKYCLYNIFLNFVVKLEGKVSRMEFDPGSLGVFSKNHLVFQFQRL